MMSVEAVGGAQLSKQRGGHQGKVGFLLFELNAQFGGELKKLGAATRSPGVNIKTRW